MAKTSGEKSSETAEILAALKEKIVELDSLIAHAASEKRSPHATQITLERIIVPPLSALKEPKKRQEKNAP